MKDILTEKVFKYLNLFSSLSPLSKDCHVALNLRQTESKTIWMDVTERITSWKNLQDKCVILSEKMAPNSNKDHAAN